jgi:hypothetical protein
VTAWIAGALAGSLHVISGPDHLAAVAPSACADPAAATRVGALWGLGHGVGIGLAVALARLLVEWLPLDVLSASAEVFVGLVLLFVGARALSRRAAPPRRGGAFAIGVLHGAAGAHHLVVVLPALLLEPLATAAYLAAYLVAAVLAMALVGALVGAGLRGRSERAHRLAHRLAGAGALAVGAFWLLL